MESGIYVQMSSWSSYLSQQCIFQGCLAFSVSYSACNSCSQGCNFEPHVGYRDFKNQIFKKNSIFTKGTDSGHHVVITLNIYIIDSSGRRFDPGSGDQKTIAQSLGSFMCNITFRSPSKEKQNLTQNIYFKKQTRYSSVKKGSNLYMEIGAIRLLNNIPYFKISFLSQWLIFSCCLIDA